MKGMKQMRTASKLVKTLLMQLSTGLTSEVRILVSLQNHWEGSATDAQKVPCPPGPEASVFNIEQLKTATTQCLPPVPAFRSDTNSISTYSDYPSKLKHV